MKGEETPMNDGPVFGWWVGPGGNVHLSNQSAIMGLLDKKKTTTRLYIVGVHFMESISISLH